MYRIEEIWRWGEQNSLLRWHQIRRMCYRSISRWYRLIIIVISIHLQFHLHTQHKQFTPKNFICMEFTRKRRAKNKKRHTEWLFTSIQHIREQYSACLSKRWTYITVINAIHVVYQCCHWTAGENHLHSRRKKAKIACLLSYIHVRSIKAFNFRALISFCSISIVFFPFLLFANYIEQLFGASLDLGETPSFFFFFSFLASEKKYTEVSYMIQMVIFVVVPNS